MQEKHFAGTLYLPKLLGISPQSLVLIIQRSMACVMPTKLNIAYTSYVFSVVSDRNRNSHFRTKLNIRQLKTTEYSVSVEYSALLLPFGRKSLIYFMHTAKLVEFRQNLTIYGVCLPGFKHYYMLTNI
jgi:hypothetical protein